MSSTPAVDLDARPRVRVGAGGAVDDADAAAPAMRIMAGVFALGVASADLLTYYVNLPIAYIVPLLLIERTGSRRWLWQATGVLVALTYIGLFFGRRAPGGDAGFDVLNARIVNRTMTAGMLLCVSLLLHRAIAMRERARRARHLWPHDPDGLSYARAVASIDSAVAPALAGVLVIALFVADAIAHAPYNVAVLYVLPLVVLARTRSRAVLWFGLPILTGAALGGLWVGRDPADEQVWNLVVNRALVCLAMLAVALLLHARLRTEAGARATPDPS